MWKSKRTRRPFTSEQKAEILRRHMADKVKARNFHLRHWSLWSLSPAAQLLIARVTKLLSGSETFGLSVTSLHLRFERVALIVAVAISTLAVAGTLFLGIAPDGLRVS